MLAKVSSFGIWGIDAYPVEIEVDVARGLPGVTIVGMADTAIRESKERVKSAIKNSDFRWPGDKITVNLAPSDIHKEGSSFDLAIALGILAASEQISLECLRDYFILGEMALDGSLRSVRATLPAGLATANSIAKNLIIPAQNAKEAAIVKEISAFAMKTLKETVEFLNSPEMYKPFKTDLSALLRENSHYGYDFSEVKGQYQAKRALEVAVAGSHNILMIGPPGSGKTMLAKRIPTIMPALTTEESLEVTKIHSSSGLFNINGIVSNRPFRSPHQGTSSAALIGGGPIPQPGEISLAHRGVLFLDELPEFRRDTLESLRQPLEDGWVRICRAKRSLTFPSSFMLVAAMNPCPCGYYTDPLKTCKCSPNKIENYMAKISGPLLDRIDIHIELAAVRYKDLVDEQDTEKSEIIKTRVEHAREEQKQRFKEENIFHNSQMDAKLTKKYCNLKDEGKKLLKSAITELGLSARAYNKILKVSRTIADLAGSDCILSEHVAEAIQYRSLDKQ